MTEEFQKLQQLHKEGKVFISYRRAIDPFQTWLLWFSGQLSKKKKGSLKWKGAYMIYATLTSFWMWIPLSTALAIFSNKFYLLLLVLPLLISYIFRPIGRGFLTYDLLKDENLLDTLWVAGIVGGIVSKEMKEGRVPKFGIWAVNFRDWRDGIKNLSI